MREHYILEGRTVIPADLMTWAKWFEEHREDRMLWQDHVGERWVSTVFLGLDHRMGEIGPPLLFETMVFPSKETLTEVFCDRCSTYDEAEIMHQRACQWVRKGEPEDY